jgi:phosphoribosylaminoimidazolecarboxamide formyltransferase/IMP cyclohydrolase
MKVQIKSALISVYYKDGLDEVVLNLHKQGVNIYTTGGTQTFIESLGVPVIRVEDLTGYPSILGGRVKTLHPKVFGGILAMRNEDHLAQLNQYQIPPIDLVIVDLYPFEETVAAGGSDADIIEKIDIGGISLIRAAAKNFNDVVVIASKAQYQELNDILIDQQGVSSMEQRRSFSAQAFRVSSSYDHTIQQYLRQDDSFSLNVAHKMTLRYGENPHQDACFFGDIDSVFEQLCGKELSFNNLVDIDAALQLIQEFKDDGPTFAILKHTNACGVATRINVAEAWDAALAADPVSAFGGILICNTPIDKDAAEKIDKIFYEVLIAPGFSADAEALLSAKSKRVLLRLKSFDIQPKQYKSLINGVVVQDADLSTEVEGNFVIKTNAKPSAQELKDLVFALKCAKHLKSNTIVLAKNSQLLGMGCGQTSRVDACQHAIHKAKHFGFDLHGAVMASDAFFPFPDCVELVHKEGINAVVQPGGSIKDQLSIDFCDAHGMTMVFTGIRHFKH